MKKNIDKYPNYETLPDNAITVDKYCKLQDYSTAYLYKLIKEKKNKGFELIVFQGINFVLPKNAQELQK